MGQAATAQAEFHTIWLDAITVEPGHNPRRHFDPTALKELAESIASQGLIQPILVRPDPNTPGQYLLVAGERRLRAAREAGLTEIPATVRDLDDREARLIALRENTDRADLSPAEEARYARQWVDTMDGDRNEAAKQLGWSRKKLDARLLLTHATDKVLTALEEGRIQIGHAELLAGQPEQTQDGSIDKMIEKRLTVADLKKRIAAFITPLSQAIFDKTECQGCRYNTEQQANLFSTALDGGNCQNRECFASKTRAALDERKQALQGEYHVVRFLSEVTPDNTTVIVADGPSGVGRRQLQQCRACPHHGATLRDSIDARAGELTEDVCHNLSCHRKMVEAHQKPAAPEKPAPANSGTSAKGTTDKPGKGKKTAKKDKGPEVTKALHAHINNRLVVAAEQAVTGNDADPLRYAILALYRYAQRPDANAPYANPGKEENNAAERAKQALREAVPGQDDKESDTKLGQITNAVGGSAQSDAKILNALQTLDAEALANLHRTLAGIVATAGRTGKVSPETDHAAIRAVPVLAHHGIRLADCCPVDADLLKTVPRKAAEAIVADTGFDEWIDQQDDAADRRKALKQAKASEYPDRVMEQGFDFTGKTPALIARFDPVTDDNDNGSDK